MKRITFSILKKVSYGLISEIVLTDILHSGNITVPEGLFFLTVAICSPGVKDKQIIDLTDRFKVYFSKNSLDIDPLTISRPQPEEELKDAIETVKIYNIVSKKQIPLPTKKDITDKRGVMDYISDKEFPKLLVNYNDPVDTLSISRNMRIINARQRNYQLYKTSGQCYIRDDDIFESFDKDKEVRFNKNALTTSGAIYAALAELRAYVSKINICKKIINNTDTIRDIIENLNDPNIDTYNYTKGIRAFCMLVSHIELKYVDKSKDINQTDLDLINSIKQAKFSNPICQKFQERLLKIEKNRF